MGSDPWWSVYPPLLVGSLFGWLLAMLTPVCSERITLWFRGPKLQLDFTNTEDCVTLTPEEFQVTLVSFQKRVVFFARIKVTNLMPRIATQCQAWLVNVEAGDGYGDFKPTIFKDSIPLIWVQPVWLQLLRDRKSLKCRGKAPARGIGLPPVTRSTAHYSPSGAEMGRSGDLS